MIPKHLRGLTLLAMLILALWALWLSSCTPQQSASLMPMMGMGQALTSQAANLYMTEQEIELQRAQQRSQQLQR
jgi:hypothetical protein